MSLFDNSKKFEAILEILSDDNSDEIFEEAVSYNDENPDCTYQDIIDMLRDSNEYGSAVRKFLDTSTEFEKEFFQEAIENLLDNGFKDDNELFERILYFIASEDPLALSDMEAKVYDEQITKDFKEHHKSFVYDQSLPQEIIDMYQVGQIIFHPNYLFGSGKDKKCITNCRFKIYTTGFLYEFQERYSFIEEDRDILVSTVAEAFKVVDICKKKKVTQITLVNIPIITESFMREHKASFEDYFLKKARKDFYKSFKFRNTIDAHDLEYSSLALGIFKHKGEYKFFTKSDMCNFLLIISTIYDAFDMDFVDDLLLKYDVDNLISQYLTFEENNNYDDSDYQTFQDLKCNLIAPVEFADMLMDTYSEFSQNKLKLVEDNMDKYLLNWDDEIPLIDPEIANLLYKS